MNKNRLKEIDLVDWVEMGWNGLNGDRPSGKNRFNETHSTRQNLSIYNRKAS